MIKAAILLLSEGLPVSIASIADTADITEDEVQDHIGTRKQLFAALNETYLQDFDNALAFGNTRALAALQYAQLSLKGIFADDAQKWRAMLVANVVDRDIAARWSHRLTIERAYDQAPAANALLVRLAADGLRLADLLSTYSISEKERMELAVLMTSLIEQQ